MSPNFGWLSIWWSHLCMSPEFRRKGLAWWLETVVDMPLKHFYTNKMRVYVEYLHSAISLGQLCLMKHVQSGRNSWLTIPEPVSQGQFPQGQSFCCLDLHQRWCFANSCSHYQKWVFIGELSDFLIITIRCAFHGSKVITLLEILSSSPYECMIKE